MKKTQIWLLVVVGILFIALGIYYWLTEAGSLPHWLPGYESGSAHKHLKHGLAAVVLGLGCWVWAWFAGGSKTASKPEAES